MGIVCGAICKIVFKFRNCYHVTHVPDIVVQSFVEVKAPRFRQENCKTINGLILSIATVVTKMMFAGAKMVQCLRDVLEILIPMRFISGKNDWWWHAMVGMCHFRLNQVREAEENYLLSLQVRRTVLVTHFLANVHIKQDQPLRAIECYQQGLESPEGANDPTLTTAIARVYAAVGDNANAVAMYNAVLENDSTNAEAIACVAADCFYSDRPENALLLYRRLLQIGVSGPELLNNLGLSCFYAQQYDMAISCFERAISMTDDDTALAEIWYNIANVAINLGDIGLGYQCFKLAITCDPSHAEAYVNLGVLEHRKGNLAPAMAHYDSALRLAPQLYEPHYNKAVICSTQGDMQGCFQSATNAHEVFGAHRGSQALLKDLRSLFAMV
eukprot:m.997922 g.997922  ORF g.997922 m.997922 type:complete len:385 (-) comp24023_c0_seq13:2520-3674(-)